MQPLIIFDCDGVLVDSEGIASAVLAESLVSAGYPYTQETCITQFTGLSLHSCRLLIERDTGRLLTDDFFSQVQHKTFARFSEMLQAVPGVVDVLEFLRVQQWPRCVASSGSHDKMALTLGKTGLQDYFGDRIFSASDVARGKPAPDLFLHAARTLGYSPAHCIVVEDSLPGVQAGVAAGMQVCALGSAHEISADVHRFLCMAELPAILVSLQERYFMDRNRDANIIDAR